MYKKLSMTAHYKHVTLLNTGCDKTGTFVCAYIVFGDEYSSYIIRCSDRCVTANSVYS